MKKIIPLLFVSFPLYSAVEVLSVKKEVYAPKTLNSSLKSYEMIVSRKRFKMAKDPITEANYMTDLRIILKTKTVADIKKYGVVQLIRGCKWRSSWDGKEIKKELSINRDHFGQSTVFRHTDWEVDSDSTDPLYHSYEGDRFALWKWNVNPADHNPVTAKYLHFKPSPHPVVFFTDLPGTSAKSAGKNSADNSTLDFKTCLFQINDLPLKTDVRGSNIDFKKALHCFEWKDHFVFDFKSMTMTGPKAIDEICK